MNSSSTSTEVGNIALAAGFVVLAAALGYRYIGLPPVIIVGGSGLIGLLAWSTSYLKRPTPPEIILPRFLLTVAALEVHIMDEYLTGFAPAMSRLFNVTWTERGLHRYCARMTGSVMDGEDVVQEALIEAYRKLDKYDESRPLKPWLFRIAHNRCIDFLRRRGVRDEAEAAATMPETVSPAETATVGVGKAVEHLVASLPPKERACVLLKDVFDYSLEEIAELVLGIEPQRHAAFAVRN